MTKVFIIGGPGSGKTTLGVKLAAATSTVLFDLDSVAYENGAGAERSPEAREASIQEILRQQSWIAEGWYTGWTANLADAADVIIWLDVPWRTARWRIISRHAKASFRRTNPHPGLRKLVRFIKSSKDFYVPQNAGDGRDQMDQWLAAYQSKLYRCEDSRDVTSAVEHILRG